MQLLPEVTQLAVDVTSRGAHGRFVLFGFGLGLGKALIGQLPRALRQIVEPFGIHFVDAETGRGVPLVEAEGVVMLPMMLKD